MAGPVPEPVSARRPRRGAGDTAVDDLRTYARASADEVAARLSSGAVGLTAAEAGTRLNQQGPNRIPERGHQALSIL